MKIIGKSGNQKNRNRSYQMRTECESVSIQFSPPFYNYHTCTWFVQSQKVLELKKSLKSP